jgi:zinc transport system ATP-binding protein
MVSHDMYMTSQYATKILHLDGKQLFFGTKDEYFDSKIGSQFVNYSA